MTAAAACRWLLQVGLAALAAATLAAQQPRQQVTGGAATISGIVVVAGTDTPVRGATVRITALADRFETTTDGDGRFEFRNVPATVTTIGATKAGYVSQTITLSERGLGPLSPGTNVRVDIPLVRGTVIAGRVFDHYGDPLSGAVVSALRLLYQQPGQPTIQPVGVGQTNDLGEYRIYGLNPGAYFVAVGVTDVMQKFYAAKPAPSGGPAEFPNLGAPRAAAPAFFPGTTNPSDAQQIVLASGDQALGTDFRMTNTGMIHIAGRVVDSLGAGVEDTYVLLAVAGSTGALPGGSRVTSTDSAGAFAFPSIPPGEYVIHAVALATPLGVAAREKGEVSSERGMPEFASERVSALGDQLGVHVQTRPGVDVKGRVMVDGVVVHPAAAKDLRIVAAPAWTGGAMINSLMTTEAVVTAEGTFMLKNTSGHRVFQVTGLPAGSFLSRVVVGGIDVTDSGMDMRQAASGVTVELSTKPAVLDVAIQTSSGRPASGAVVVFSEDAQLWTLVASRHLLLRAATGAPIRVNSLPPGRYLVAPISTADRSNWADPAFLARLRQAATSVTLIAGETRAVTVKWY